jgi:hypothetical protein
MLCRNNYGQDYIDACRRKVAGQVAAYRALATAAGSRKAQAALDAFEPVFFNNLVLALENYFVHRARGIEGKDGNPANEVRVLAASLMSPDGTMGVDRTMKMKPENTILNYEPGETIAIREAEFTQLAKAYFAEIEAKFAD